MRRLLTVVLVFVAAHTVPVWAAGRAAAPAARVYLPLVMRRLTSPGQPPVRYETLPVFSAPTDRPAEEHPDLNLALRGYAPTDAARSLVDYGGATDDHAPRLTGLFSPPRTPQIRGVYRVYAWDWSGDAPGAPIASPPVTLIALQATRGEALHLPPSGYDIGSGYQALVLYAAPHRLTLRYTREDNVVTGYTLHIEGLDVHPALLATYRAADAAGRGSLPALRAGQAVGVAADAEIGVAIRDAGTFMDPRSRKDWW